MMPLCETCGAVIEVLGWTADNRPKAAWCPKCGSLELLGKTRLPKIVKAARLEVSKPAAKLTTDDLMLATEEWLNQEFGHESDSDFAIEQGEDRNEIWHRGQVRVELPRDLMTRKNCRAIVAFLRSFEQ